MIFLKNRYALLCISSIVFTSFSWAQTVEGLVRDRLTGAPLSYATVGSDGGDGAVCNHEGEFQIRISERLNQLKIGHAGYKTQVIEVSDAEDIVIDMERDTFSFREVTVTAQSKSGYEILQEAMEEMDDSYHTNSLNSDAFYREIVQLDLNEYQVEDSIFEFMPLTGKRIAEAALKSYIPGHAGRQFYKKSSYQLENGRYIETNQDYESVLDSQMNDLVMNMKVKGGLDKLEEATIRKLYYDDFLTKKKFYRYKIIRMVNFNGRIAYEIQVEPRRVKKSLYKGRVLIDRETKAIVYLEYAKSKRHLKYANHIKLLGVDATTRQDSVQFVYEYINNEWVLKYAHVYDLLSVNINRKIDNKKTHIQCDYITDLALLHTQYYTENVSPIPTDKLFKKRDQLAQKYTHTYDPKFWENKTILPLDSKIQEELEAL